MKSIRFKYAGVVREGKIADDAGRFVRPGYRGYTFGKSELPTIYHTTTVETPEGFRQFVTEKMEEVEEV